jgi:anthranilate/para-aminobenzoate synthase component II
VCGVATLASSGWTSLTQSPALQPAIQTTTAANAYLVPFCSRTRAAAVADIEALAPRTIVVSPGPGAPKDAGISCDAIRAFAGRIPILGVCLGA